MPTFRRLLGFLRPYRRTVIWSLAFAWAAMVITVVVPLLIGAAVDAINEGDRDALMPIALALVGAGLLRLGLTVVRRLIAGKVSLAVEFDLRQGVYEHLQRLELGFFDGQQTGQLMSRSTVDLAAIRFFLGYGLIFLTQNALTIALASVVMFALNPWLAALALIPVPFVIIAAARFSRLSRPAVQEVQQRIAELTAEAEESVSGVRIVKAFAREAHMLTRFRRQVNRVFDQNVYSTRLRAFYSPMLGFIPSLGLAVVLWVGGREVIEGDMSLGTFTAFYTYLIMLMGPMRMLGMALGMAQRAVASGNRLFEILDRDPRITSPPDAPGCRRAPARSASSASTSDTAPGPALTGIDLEVKAGRTVALVGPTGSARPPGRADRAPLRPERGQRSVDGANMRSVDVASCVARSRSSPWCSTTAARVSQRKGCDLLVVNEVGVGVTFGRDESTVHLLRRAPPRSPTWDLPPSARSPTPCGTPWSTCSPAEVAARRGPHREMTMSRRSRSASSAASNSAWVWSCASRSAVRASVG